MKRGVIMSDMPIEVKDYLKKGKRKIIKIYPNNDFTLTLTFDNGEVRCFDMKPKLKGIMEPFKNINRFKEAFIDENGSVCWDIDPNLDSNVHWNNRVDFCPDSMYIYSTLIEEDNK